MKFFVVPLAALVLLLGWVHAADDKARESPWYPLKVGTKWHYKVGANKFLMQVAKHEKVGDVVCGLLEMSKEGNVLNSEYIAVKDDGIYRLKSSDDKPENAFRILKLPPKKGDSWTVDVKLGNQSFKGTFKLGQEEITVPAGQYKTLNAVSDGFQTTDADGNVHKIIFKFWFAEKAGLVKQTVQVGDRPEVMFELEKLENP